jgi:hypothetical protein
VPSPAQRMAALIPDPYDAGDPSSLLRRLLDAVGAELDRLAESRTALLRSHWVDHATGPALDGLGAALGAARRLRRDGSLEEDEDYRRRLRAVVAQFTGGGTVAAVLGSVRSALGLPFDLDALGLPAGFAQLRADIEALVRLVEFSPEPETVRGSTVREVDGASQLDLDVTAPAVRAASPRITWTFRSGRGRMLRLERVDTGTGVASRRDLVVPEGAALVLTAGDGGRLDAVLDGREVGSAFTNLDGSTPAVLPDVPAAPSRWRFRAGAGFDTSGFDEDTFDLPAHAVELTWSRTVPLTFDVHVPYFLQEAVATLVRRHGYRGQVLVYQGLPIDRLQEVVDDVRACGVRGSVHFTLDFSETHGMQDALAAVMTHHVHEDAAAEETPTVGSVSSSVTVHDVEEALALGGVFDVATFDGHWGFTA